MNAITRSICFAAKAHAGQKRKYNGRDYFEHPIRVSCRVASLDCFDEPIILPDSLSRHEVAVIAAALHDVIEDCGVSLEQIELQFGVAVGAVVWQLTNPPRDHESRRGLNRAARKALDREHIKAAGPTPRIIKLLDHIDNLSEIIVDSKTNAEAAKSLPVYREESRLLLEALAGTHAELELELKGLCAL
jgi:(p)ppGpp synthase/HD superfamily hydrolase